MRGEAHAGLTCPGRGLQCGVACPGANRGLNRHLWPAVRTSPRAGRRADSTYSVTSMPTEEELEDLMEGEAVSVEPCCSLGDDGAEESGVAISSMSEYDEADLGPFFMLKALLKELRSWKKADPGRETSGSTLETGGTASGFLRQVYRQGVCWL